VGGQGAHALHDSILGSMTCVGARRRRQTFLWAEGLISVLQMNEADLLKEANCHGRF